ncbi:MAG: histidine kinase [Brevinematia bacterium]
MENFIGIGYKTKYSEEDSAMYEKVDINVKSDEEFLSVVEKLINEKKYFYLKFYGISEEIERRLNITITKIFEKFGRSDLADIIYTCVKELVINASKANIKRVVFEENNIDFSDEKSFLEGMIKYKNELSESKLPKYISKLSENNLYISVAFYYSEDGVRIEVVNNVSMTDFENKRIREKLKKAMGYDDISQFYLEQGDELEGAGLGIALIVMLLKGVGIDPSLFRISGPNNNFVLARIEVPLTEKYVSVRGKR